MVGSMRRKKSIEFLKNMVEMAGPELEARQVAMICRLICRRLGGCDVYVPQHISDTQTCNAFLAAYEEVLGAAGSWQLQQMLRLYGGSHLYIAQEINAFRQSIAMEVLKAREDGVSTLDLVRRYKVSGRTISELYALALDLRYEMRQQKLF